MNKPVLGWWFGDVLGYGDGRKAEAGVTHTVEGPPVLCKNGLCASKRIIDALEFAKCSKLWRVEESGEIVHGDDKMAATSRTYLWSIDATDLLRDFSRREALDVAHLWAAPPVVLHYLRTGDESARVSARDAAWVSAWVSARAAAWAAAWDAARDNAWAAAWYARAAARDAARAAARDAAWYAARGAARDAARDAAWYAACDRQNRRLTAMVIAEKRRQA